MTEHQCAARIAPLPGDGWLAVNPSRKPAVGVVADSRDEACREFHAAMARRHRLVRQARGANR